MKNNDGLSLPSATVGKMMQIKRETVACSKANDLWHHGTTHQSAPRAFCYIRLSALASTVLPVLYNGLGQVTAFSRRSIYRAAE